MSISLKTIFIFEVIIVFAMVMGFIPQEFSYLILILLSVGFFKMSMLDALKLFIISIPFFVALPSNSFSDSMSIWRVLIVVLFLKMVLEKYGIAAFEKRSFSLENTSRCEFTSESVVDQGLALFRFVLVSMQKILKQVQNDKIKDRIFSVIKRVFKNKLFLYTTIFFVMAMISLFYAPSFGMGIKKILFLLNIILLFPIVSFSIKKEEDFMQILRYIFYATSVIVLIGYFQFISTFFVPLHTFWQFWAGNVIKTLYGQNLSDLLSFSNTWFSYYKSLPPTLRMFSVMPDSHSFAMFIVISIPALLALLFYYGNIKKRFFSLSLILFFMAIVFSGSRGSWVGSFFALFAAGLLIYPRIVHSMYCQKQNHKKNNLRALKDKLINNESYFLKIIGNINHKKDARKIIMISVLLFLFLMPISFLFLGKNQQMQSYISGQGISIEKSDLFERAKSISDFSEISNKGRFQIWSETLVFVQKNLFTGVGFGNFPFVLGEDISNVKRGSSAHNIYLDILSEMGIFGLAIFSLIIFEILRTAYSLYFQIERKHLKIFVGSFFVYFSWIFGYGLFDVVLFNDKVLMLVVIMTSLLYCVKSKAR